MKKISITLVGLFVFATGVRSAIWTSYLSIEVPTVATALYEVTYDTTLFADPSRISGADLLDCVFGMAADDGIYTDAFFGTYTHSTAGTASDAVGYIDFFGSSFVESFTIAGTNYAQDTDYDPSWAYYVAGGTGDNALGLGLPGAYGSGSFVVAEDGLSTRQVSDGSFDAWVLSDVDGVTFLPISAPSVSPVVGDFVTAIRVGHVPEPSRVVLVFLGTGLLFFRRVR